MISETILETPLGLLELRGDAHGLAEIVFCDPEKKKENRAVPRELIRAVEQLNAYFAGGRRYFSIKLNPSGTDFQKRVWHFLETIPYGKTISYKTQSERMGNLKAVRAVAAANGKNPLPIVVPCHRVIGSDGALTGYAGGLWRKRWLLRHEKA